MSTHLIKQVEINTQIHFHVAFWLLIVSGQLSLILTFSIAYIVKMLKLIFLTLPLLVDLHSGFIVNVY